MTTYYKAVNLDLTSRHGLRWDVGTIVTHPTSTEMVRNNAATYLSLSVEPAETLIGRNWPARLLTIEPIGEVIDADRYPHKRCCLSAYVTGEIDAWRTFGPQGEHVVALIDRTRLLTGSELNRLEAARYAAWEAAWEAARYAAWEAAWEAARYAAWEAAWDAARYAAREAARDAARYAAWEAARYAALALIVRDLVGTTPGWDQAGYDLPTGPWRRAVGPVHPDDPALDGDS